MHSFNMESSGNNFLYRLGLGGLSGLYTSHGYTYHASSQTAALGLVELSKNWCFLFLDTFEYGKCLETGKTTKSLEIVTFFKGFCRFPISRHF